jgi:hypothetical protein
VFSGLTTAGKGPAGWSKSNKVAVRAERAAIETRQSIGPEQNVGDMRESDLEVFSTVIHR